MSFDIELKYWRSSPISLILVNEGNPLIREARLAEAIKLLIVPRRDHEQLSASDFQQSLTLLIRKCKFNGKMKTRGLQVRRAVMSTTGNTWARFMGKNSSWIPSIKAEGFPAIKLKFWGTKPEQKELWGQFFSSGSCAVESIGKILEKDGKKIISASLWKRSDQELTRTTLFYFQCFT